MLRAPILLTALLLALPAAAHAKAGVEFQRYPESTPVGHAIKFTVLAYRDPPPSGGAGHPLPGAHPLVIFRSASGRVIRVRASRTDAQGFGHGSVRFTDRGPWTTELRIRGLHVPYEASAPVSVGTGLVQTIPAASSDRPRAPHEDSGGSSALIWVLALASIGSAMLVLVRRRRGHWGAA